MLKQYCQGWNSVVLLAVDPMLSAGMEGTMGCLLHYSPKFCNNGFLFVGLITLGTFFKILIVYYVKCLTFQPLIVINRRCNFVWYDWVFTLIYRPLTHPFRSLGWVDEDSLVMKKKRRMHSKILRWDKISDKG